MTFNPLIYAVDENVNWWLGGEGLTDYLYTSAHISQYFTFINSYSEL